ncbi:MAG: ATP-binding protein [Coriobacteriia bacterium]
MTRGLFPGIRPRPMAIRISLTYATAAVTWIVASDAVEAALDLPPTLSRAVNTGKGILFVAVTATFLYLFARRFLSIANLTHERYRRVQEELHTRDRSIRQAYIEVLAAVTGGKLILMWPDEVDRHLGEVVLPDQAITRPDELTDARARLAPVLEVLPGNADAALLAANEGITNALKHAGGGEYGVRRTSSALQIVLTDRGPGIDFHTLPRATLIAGYSTKTSLGIGFTIMFDAAERILLATEEGLTTLVLEFPLVETPPSG